MAANHVSYSAAATSRPQLSASRMASSVVQRTKILLLGLRRAGKTSIQEVLFNKLPVKQTFYLETTMRIARHPIECVLEYTPSIATVIPLEVWDCPGNITVDSLGTPLSQFPSLIFVIDIRDLYNQPITKLIEFIVAAYQQNPDINIEVFVHKTEGIQEDDKIENFRQIQERVTERLLDLSPEYEQIQPNFYLTSIYNHSLHEAFSRVLHKLIDSLPYLEDMLNVFCANSQSPKAFLFDTRSRLYIATDASPVDNATHDLCCNYLQMLNSFGSLYKSASASPLRCSGIPPAEAASPPSRSSMNSSPLTTSAETLPQPARRPPKELFYPSAATSLHPATPGTTLTYHAITSSLALLALVPTAVYEGRRGLLEYNVVFFREGVQEICDVETETRGGG